MEHRTTHGARLLALALMIALVTLACCACSAAPAIAEVPAVTLITADHTAQDDRILIVTGEYSPYVAQDPDHPGLFTEIVQAAAAEADLDIGIEYYPWDRCRQMVQQGLAWAAYPFEHSGQNDGLFAFSQPVCHATQKFYCLTTNKTITQSVKEGSRIEDFKGYTFGGTNGYWYGGRVDFRAAGVKVEWTGGTDGLVKMLHAGRIDFFIEDQRVADEAIGRLFPDDAGRFATLPHAAKECDYHLIVSRDNADSQVLLRRFDAALDKLRATGDYGRILARYGIADS